MSGTFTEELVKFSAAIGDLNAVLQGADDETVDVDGVTKPTISKAMKDSIDAKYGEISALIADRLVFENKSEMDLVTPTIVSPATTKAAEVLNDSTAENNGLYVWDVSESEWVLSPYSSSEDAATTETSGSDEYLRYKERMRAADEEKPRAAIVVLLGQSLNQIRGTNVKSTARGKMLNGGAGTSEMMFAAANAEHTAHYDDLTSIVNYEETTGQGPGVGIISALSGSETFAEIYAVSCAIGARGIDILRANGPIINVNACCHRLAELARDAGYNPYIMFYSAHGESDAGTSMSESDYYAKATDFYHKCQVYAAQAMRKPDYIAPVVLTYPLAAHAGEIAIKTAIRRIAKDNKNIIDAGGVYQWPFNTDRTHPTSAGTIGRGEYVGLILRNFYDKNTTHNALHITDVELDVANFKATFSDAVTRDTTFDFSSSLEAATQKDGLQWFDNGTAIAITELTYMGRTVSGVLASVPTGSIAQQELRIASHIHTGALTAATSEYIAGSLARASDFGEYSIYDSAYINRNYAIPQIFNTVREL